MNKDSSSFKFRLPGGYVTEDGALHREVVLGTLTGREEELLARNDGPESASLVTQVISRCLKRLGTLEPVSEDTVRSLVVADRQFLLLKLREMTFGDRVEATVSCPWPDCGKSVDINFSIRDIPIEESAGAAAGYHMELPEEAAFEAPDGSLYREVSFRLPNGGDQEKVSPLLERNEAEALNQLLERCILSIGHINRPDRETILNLTPLTRMEIEKEMAHRAPRLDLDMETDCPECSRMFNVPFDLHNFFFGQLRTSIDLLYREVHYLAFHYHWSEEEIMEMSRGKRLKYIEVLADEIERMNHAAEHQ
jgi:hypothetical protein